MIRISNSFLINGLREIGSSLLTRIKHISSVLAHIGSVSNTAENYYQKPMSCHKRDPSQIRTPDIPSKTRHTEKSLISLPLMKLAARIEPIKEDLQLRPAISPSIGLIPTRRAPLPPLSEPMIEKLLRMIESDKQLAKSPQIADSKPAIKDVRFDTQMCNRK